MQLTFFYTLTGGEPGISDSISSAAFPESTGISGRKNPVAVKRFLHLLTHVKCLAFIVVILAGGTAAGGEEIELIIGEFNVLVIGELHDLIHVFTVIELFLLFIAQVGEDPFQ